MSKKLEQKQRRRLAEQRKKEQQRKAAQRRNLITIAVAGVVAILVVALIVQQRSGSGRSNSDFGVSAAAAGCLPVEHPKPLPGIHIGLGAHHRPYDSSPPTSGPHYPPPIAPIDPGFYSIAQTPEKVVHNLEHGNIVIWYNPDAPEQTKSDIRAAVNEVPSYTLATPYPNMKPGYNIALTAWGELQFCKQVSKQVLDDFRTKYQGRGASTEENLSPTFTAPQ
ncbi:MAG TPA: DUF3105 domain-containing protein [Actinomycetota bacterium]|nr:DUF3105 domain-containing protein [Actinomycetota bacterium]